MTEGGSEFRTLDGVDVQRQARAGPRGLQCAACRTARSADDTRLRAALPTIDLLRKGGAKVILLSHFDRPKGKRVPSMSLRPVVAPLAKLLGAPVAFADDCVGEIAERGGRRAEARRRAAAARTCASTPARRPTIRPSPASWRRIGDLYVDDAFSAAHRAHASTEASRTCCPPMRARPCGASWPRWTAPWASRAAGAGHRRRLEGLDQARPAAQSDPQARPAGHRRRHGQHLPLRPGLGGGRLLLREGAGRHRAGHHRASPRRAIANSCCPSTSSSAEQTQPGAAARVRELGESIEHERILDAGPEDGGAAERGHGRGQDPDLERPAGRLRGAAVRQGHHGRRAPRRRAGQGRQAGGGGRRR